MKVTIIKWIISFGALIAAGVHIIFPALNIDGITVTLLGIACIPWLAPLFSSVELPGVVKVEFQDLNAAGKKVEETGLLPPKEKKEIEGVKRHVYAFEAVAGSDLNLALAGLRIEIESRLRKIAKAQGIAEEQLGMNRLARDLVKQGALSKNEVSAVADLLPLLNRAAHGATVEDQASEWALEFGPRLLGALEERLGETSIPKLIKQWRKRDGAAFVEIGTELSKALVQSPRAFLRAMKKDTESFNSWLDGIEQHTFTIFESTSEVDGDLYSAHYLKLKELIQNAVKPFIGTELNSEASRVLDVLDKIKIRHVW